MWRLSVICGVVSFVCRPFVLAWVDAPRGPVLKGNRRAALVRSPTPSGGAPVLRRATREWYGRLGVRCRGQLEQHCRARSLAIVDENGATRQLLTAEEEVALSGRVGPLRREADARIALGVNATAVEVARYCGFTDVAHFEHARDDALAAKSALIISNMRLVVSIANRYRYACALAYDDMIQEGAFGLAKAAVKFDPAKGCRFSTYATIWIKQAVFRASADQSRVIRLPANVHEHIRSIKKTTRALSAELGRDATDDEIRHALVVSGSGDAKDTLRAKARATSARKLEFFRGVSRDAVSLNQPLPSGFSASIGSSGTQATPNVMSELIKGDEPLPEERANSLFIRTQVESLLETLSERESNVLRLRYGLDGAKPHSNQQISQIYEVSPERIRQIEVRALNKLREPHRTRHLELYTYDSDS